MWLYSKLLYSWAILAHASYDGHQYMYEALVETVESKGILTDSPALPSLAKIAIHLAVRLSSTDVLKLSVMEPVYEELTEVVDEMKAAIESSQSNGNEAVA